MIMQSQSKVGTVPRRAIVSTTTGLGQLQSLMLLVSILSDCLPHPIDVLLADSKVGKSEQPPKLSRHLDWDL